MKRESETSIFQLADEWLEEPLNDGKVSNANSSLEQSLVLLADFSNIVANLVDDDEEEIQLSLFQNKNAWLSTDENGNTLLHYIIKHARVATLKMLKQFYPNILLKMIKTANIFGFTPLHYAAYCSQDRILNLMLDALENQASYEVRRVTNKGKHLLSLISEHNLKEATEQRVINLCQSSEFPELNKKILLQDVLKKYPEIKNDLTLLNHYQLALLAMNYVRQKIRFSTTHPESNNQDRDSYRSVATVIDLARNFIDEKHLTINQSVEHEIRSINKTRVGNCQEIATYIAYLLFILGVKATIELCYLKPGDHAFVIINGGDFKNLKQLNDEAIVVDGWSAKLCPGSRFLQELRYHTRFKNVTGKTLSMTGPINPFYHQLHTCGELKFLTDKKLAEYAIFQDVIRTHLDIIPVIDQVSKNNLLEKYAPFILKHPDFIEKLPNLFFKYFELLAKYPSLFKLHDETNILSFFNSLALILKSLGEASRTLNRFKLFYPLYVHQLKEIEILVKNAWDNFLSNPAWLSVALEQTLMIVLKLEAILAKCPMQIQTIFQNYAHKDLIDCLPDTVNSSMP